MNKEIPKFVHPFLWSYDVSRLDIEKDKKRIITNVLNFGTDDAIEWLFTTYTRPDIIGVLQDPLPGEWNKKSLCLWSLVFGVTAEIKTRHIPSVL